MSDLISSSSRVERPETSGADFSLVVDPPHGTETGITIKGSGSNAGSIGINNTDPQERLDVDGNIKGKHLFGIGSCPTGLISPFGGLVAPEGWLICNGAAYKIADQQKLAEVIGTSFNLTGDDPTMFRVPNLVGRFVLGMGAGAVSKDGLGADPKAIGSSGGAESRQLSVENMATHAHGVAGHSHTATITVAEEPAHTHRFHAPGFSATHPGVALSMDIDGYVTPDDQADSPSFPAQYKITTREAGAHHHKDSKVEVSTVEGSTSGFSGSGVAFSVIPPSLVLNYIIKG